MTIHEDILNEMRSGFKRFDAKFGSLETKLGSLETRFGNFGTRLGSVESGLESLNTRIGNIEEQNKFNCSKLDKLQKSVDSLKKG